MKNFIRIAAIGAGMAALAAGASPASAQGYPYGYNNNGGGVVGAIINSVTGGGYGQYPMGNYGYAQVNSRTAVSQCAAAVEQGRSGYAQGYNQGYGYQSQGYGYQGQGYQGQGYGNQGYGGVRVVGITNVERRSNGGLKVSGIAQTGGNVAYGQQSYGYQGQGYGGYGNQAYGQAQSRFSCKVDARGVVTDVRMNQGQAYRRGY